MPPVLVFQRASSEKTISIGWILLRYAPAIFQERIKGGSDLRIAVIGQRVFVTEWYDETDYSDIPDIRFMANLRMRPVTCPESIHSKILEFHRALGLTFGVYDFKVDEHNVPFFLEVNPEGQWLDLELEAKHPITEAWARILVEGLGNESETHFSSYTKEQIRLIIQEEQINKTPENWKSVL